MMKNRLLTITIFSLFILSISAQDSTNTAVKEIKNSPSPTYAWLYNHSSSTLNNVFNEDLRYGANNRITLDFDYSGNSNAAPASLAFNMIFRRPISKALKDRTNNRIKDKLRFEDFMKTGITYQRYLKKWDGTFYVSHHHRQTRNITAAKETYELIFYGNARFEDDTVDLSNLRFQNFIFSQTSAGIKKKFDYGKYQVQFGVGLSFIQVINNQDIRTNNAWLYTAPDGEFIDINYDLSFNTAREGATNFGQLNGIGGSGDFNIGFMNRNKWKITLDISDIGIMSFRTTPVNYSAVKSVHFQGITIPDLTSFSSQTFDTLNLDSAVRANLPSRTANKYSLFIPFTASIVFSKPLLRNKLVLSAGLQYRHIPRYYVYGFAKANYFIKPDMVFSVSAGGGNYSLFNLGVDFSKSWKYFDFTIGTSNLIGLVAPSHYTGTGLYLRLATSF